MPWNATRTCTINPVITITSETMALTPGICPECGEPLAMSTSIGYHTHCAEVVYARQAEELDRTHPYVIMIAGAYAERYTTESEAEERLIHLRHAQLVHRHA